MSDRKYTLGEAAAGLTIGGFLGALMILAVIPIDIGLAWMRTQVWNWFFVPYLHAPKMSVWLMFTIILFLAMFRHIPRDLKPEHYKSSTTNDLVMNWFMEIVVFVILYGVHLWILKG